MSVGPTHPDAVRLTSIGKVAKCRSSPDDIRAAPKQTASDS